MTEPTKVERKSDREIVTTRMFNAPAALVFEAWTKAELFKRWWAPKTLGVPMRSCELDVRVGGGYRIVFGQDEAHSMAFFGRYTEVVPNERIVWTNDEAEGGAVTTVTFAEKDGRTLLTYSELYPSKEALDANEGNMMPEQFTQLDELLVELGTGR